MGFWLFLRLGRLRELFILRFVEWLLLVMFVLVFKLVFIELLRRRFLLRVVMSRLWGSRGQRAQPELWPEGVMGRVALELPMADAAGLELLRHGFESYLSAIRLWGPGLTVAMPSRSVDEVWHSALLHSRFYEKLCMGAVGWHVRHDPGPLPGKARMGPAEREAELDALARAWVGSCLHEGLDPKGGALPSLFVADRLLGISDGFHYSSDDGASVVSLSVIQDRAKALGEPASAKASPWRPWRSKASALGANK